MHTINRNDITVEWVGAINEDDDQAILALTTPDFKYKAIFADPDWHSPKFWRAELAEAVVGMKALFLKYPPAITNRSILVGGNSASFEATTDTETTNGSLTKRIPISPWSLKIARFPKRVNIAAAI
jgi:hypothetical protein